MNEPETPRRRFWQKKRYWVPFASISVLFLVAIALILSLSKDIDPIDDSDLRLPYVQIPDSRNAAIALRKHADVIEQMRQLAKSVEGQCEADPGLTWFDFPSESARINGGLMKCESVFACDQLQEIPEVVRRQESELPNLAWGLCMALKAQARSHLAEKRPLDALHAIERIQQLADICLRDPQEELFFVPGRWMRVLRLHLLASITELDDLEPQVLRTALAQVREERDTRAALKRVFRHSYTRDVVRLDALYDYSAKTGLPLGFLYKPNLTRRLLADYMRLAIPAHGELVNPGLEFFPAADFWDAARDGNLVGDVGAMRCAIPLGAMLNGVKKHAACFRVVELGLAVRLHELEHGELPTTLSAINDQLPEPLPDSLLSQLRYSREDRWLGYQEPDDQTPGDPKIAYRAEH